MANSQISVLSFYLKKLEKEEVKFKKYKEKIKSRNQ